MSRATIVWGCTALTALPALPGHAVEAATLRVPSQYQTIQGAIDASHTGDTILVAPGTYVEGLRIQDKGILTLVSETGAESTIIDGTGVTNVIELAASKNSHRTEYRISGFTIRNGSGGGIRGLGGRTHVENNIVVDNGLHDFYTYGGVRLQDSGGSITHNLIRGNRHYGVWVTDPHQVIVEGNLVEGNYFGITVDQGDGSPRGYAKVIRNIAQGSTVAAEFTARGTLHLLAADNLFLRNVDNGWEGASVNLWGGAPGHGVPMTGKFVNNTIVATAGSSMLLEFDSDLLGFEFANNIVYAASDATAMTCYNYDWRPLMRHNDVFSKFGPEFGYYCGDFAGMPGNMFVDPQFARDSWELGPASPLIDAGSNGPIKHLKRDILGRPRIVEGGRGLKVDMGAYELQSE